MPDLTSEQNPPFNAELLSPVTKLTLEHQRGRTDLNQLRAALASLAHLAAYLCKVPTAIIHLLDEQLFCPSIEVGWKASAHYLPFYDYTCEQPDIFLVADPSKDSRFAAHPLIQDSPYVRFYAGTAIVSKDQQILGVLCVIDYVTHPVAASDLQILSVLAKQVAFQLEMQQQLASTTTELQSIRQEAQFLKQSYQSLQKRIQALKDQNQQTQLLNRLGTALQTCVTSEEAYQMLSVGLPQLFPRQAGRIFALNASGEKETLVVQWGRIPAELQRLDIEQCPTLQENAWNRHSEKQTPKSQSTQFPDYQLLIDDLALSLPLVYQNEVLGLLQLYSLNRKPLTHYQRQMALAVTEQLCLSLRNLKLLEDLKVESIRDPLTGLFNRRYLVEALENILRRSLTGDYSTSLIMIDIDHFKKLNDTFGHPAGDTVLNNFGMFLKGLVRATDIACRYGGEEFTLILPGTSLEVALVRAEKLRRGIKYLNMTHGGQAMGTISISIGVSTSPQHGSTPQALLQAADAALYQAKARGRDRVVVAELP